MAKRERSPRLGHLRSVQQPERQAVHGHRAGRAKRGHGTRRPHGRASIRGRGLVPAFLPSPRVPSRPPLRHPVRWGDEPRAGVRERARGVPLAQRLQRFPCGHHRLSAQRRGKHSGGTLGKRPGILTLVSGSWTVPERASHRDGRRTRPRVGHASHHAGRENGIRQGDTPHATGRPGRANVPGLLRRDGTARQQGPA